MGEWVGTNYSNGRGERSRAIAFQLSYVIAPAADCWSRRRSRRIERSAPLRPLHDRASCHQVLRGCGFPRCPAR